MTGAAFPTEIWTIKMNEDLLRTLMVLSTDPVRIVDLYPQLYARSFVMPVFVAGQGDGLQG